MRPSLLRVVLAAVACLAATSSLIDPRSAAASSITQSQVFVVDQPDGESELLFLLQQFDPVLGTLLSVDVDVDGTFTLNGGTNPFFDDSPLVYDYVLSAQAEMSFLLSGVFGLANFFLGPEEDRISNTACRPSGLPCQLSISASAVNTASEPVPFILVTGTSIIPLTSEMIFDASFLRLGDQPANRPWSAGASWNGTVTVTYEYTPAVPEPSTALLVGLGLVGLAMGHRHSGD